MMSGFFLPYITVADFRLLPLSKLALFFPKSSNFSPPDMSFVYQFDKNTWNTESFHLYVAGSTEKEHFGA